jgi:hypothetical protein
MKRFFLFLISSCAAVSVYSQEEIPLDSISKIQREGAVKELHLEKPLLFENEFSTGEFNLVDKSMFNQPLLPDYSKNFDFIKSLKLTKYSSESFSTMGFIASPFYTNGMVFNQSTYRLNDKLSFGGNSFGAQSVFDKPRLNSSINDMSTKGASMFMQYKVSKNFKVETRVSVSSHQSPWEP